MVQSSKLFNPPANLDPFVDELDMVQEKALALTAGQAPNVIDQMSKFVDCHRPANVQPNAHHISVNCHVMYFLTGMPLQMSPDYVIKYNAIAL